MLDMVVPGFAANETLLYSPELKFYSNKVKMDENLDTNIKGLHCLGDSSGWTRGLMMASVMGVLMGRKLAEKEGCGIKTLSGAGAPAPPKGELLQSSPFGRAGIA